MSLSGSYMGSIKETQEMLDFCGAHGIVAVIETIRTQYINSAFERLKNGDMPYRFVIQTHEHEDPHAVARAEFALAQGDCS